MKRYAKGFCLVLLGGAGGLLLQRALEPLVHDTDPRGDTPPCFEIGTPYHHRFRAGCVETQENPAGAAVIYSINEDHLRSAARAEVLRRKPRVLVLGDSFVEGWWEQAEEAVPAQIEGRIPSVHFLNAGLRTTGPRMQAQRLRVLLPVYKPDALLWFLNDTDLPDDRVACALDDGKGGFTTADFELSGATARIAGRLGGSFPSRWLRRRAYAEKRRALALTEGCDPCAGVRGVVEQAKAAKIPMRAFHVRGPVDGSANTISDPATLEVLGACLKKEGVELGTVTTPMATEEARERYYWPGDAHPNPAGSYAIVDEALPVLTAWLQSIGLLNR